MEVAQKNNAFSCRNHVIFRQFLWFDSMFWLEEDRPKNWTKMFVKICEVNCWICKLWESLAEDCCACAMLHYAPPDLQPLQFAPYGNDETISLNLTEAQAKLEAFESIGHKNWNETVQLGSLAIYFSQEVGWKVLRSASWQYCVSAAFLGILGQQSSRLCRGDRHGLNRAAYRCDLPIIGYLQVSPKSHLSCEPESNRVLIDIFGKKKGWWFPEVCNRYTHSQLGGTSWLW